MTSLCPVSKISVLYFGEQAKSSNALYRADALQRIGCNVVSIDPWALLGPSSKILSWIDYRTGYVRLLDKLYNLLHSNDLISSLHPDLIWVNAGQLFDQRILGWLKERFDVPIILYNNDDPTGMRDYMRFHTLRRTISHYDCCICLRSVNYLEWLALGAKNVIRVMMSYDDVAHHVEPKLELCFPSAPSILFIGTSIPREYRDSFLLKLVQAGLPLSIMGNSWEKSPVWTQLLPTFRGKGVMGSSYANALAASTISLGLLSHGNRDLHTRRSVEVPFAGGLLCAERTSEHELFFEDGYEAVFWSTSEECISVCQYLLNEPAIRDAICTNGMLRVRELGVGNDDMVRTILLILGLE